MRQVFYHIDRLESEVDPREAAFETFRNHFAIPDTCLSTMFDGKKVSYRFSSLRTVRSIYPHAQRWIRVLNLPLDVRIKTIGASPFVTARAYLEIHFSPNKTDQ